jgi:PGF-pre-PGF domain-containing protein
MADTNTMEEIGASDPVGAVEVDGTWDVTGLDNGNLESLLVAMGMPIYNVSSLAGSDGIEEMTMVLPAFELSIDDIPNGGVFVTPTVSDMPAGLQVMAPIDVEESMGESLGPLGNMTVSFTPTAAGNNVTMMIALLDDNPEQDLTSEWPDGVPAFYIDLSFAGEFAGPDLSDEAFYDDGPLLTFTLDTDWARENDLRLPRVNLFLLDEATGEWEELRITGLPQSPVNGIYTYTAELPHMSTYAVTADRLLQGEDSDDEYDVSLSESLFVTGSVVQGQAGGGRTIVRDLAESLEIGVGAPETQHQRVITIEEVRVAVNIADIGTAPAFGTAVATLNFEITNAGDSDKELEIRYWYSNGAGIAHEGRQTVAIGARASTTNTVEIPFSSAGSYDVMIEVASRDGTVATTDIVIEVPWLSVYLYILVLIAIVVVVASVGYVAYATRVAGKK